MPFILCPATSASALRPSRTGLNEFYKTSFVRLVLGSGLCLASSLASLDAQPYTFSTIAGGVGQTGTNDGSGPTARFNGPQGVAVAQDGSVFVADTSNYTIRKLTWTGSGWKVATVLGVAGQWDIADGTNALLFRVSGLCLDLSSNLFMTDLGSIRIRKAVPAGTNWVVITLAGSVQGSADGTNSSAQFGSPYGLAVDVAGNIFVADTGNHTIRKVTPVGTNWVVTTIAGFAGSSGGVDGTNGQARFRNPFGIAVDPAGNLYVADTGGATIRKLKPVGTNWVVSTIAGSYFLRGSVDGTNNHARFFDPISICLDAAGNLYLAEEQAGLIRKVSPVGTNWVVSTLAGLAVYDAFGNAIPGGSADGTGTNADFYNPMGIAIDGKHDLFVCDKANATIRLGRYLPSLQIASQAENAVLSWPAPASNFVLETSSAVGPSASWSPMTNAPARLGDSFVLSNKPTGPAAFYRLRRQ